MKKTALAIAFTALCCSLWGYNLRRISKHDGLSNSAILTMCQDGDGAMWFGTVDGLNMYDGRTLAPLRLSEGYALSGNLIESVIESGPHVLWVQTSYSLNRVDKRRGTVESFGQYASNHRLRRGGDVHLMFVRERRAADSRARDSEMVYYNQIARRFDSLPLEGVDHGALLDYFVGPDNALWLLSSRGPARSVALVLGADGRYTLGGERTVEHPEGLACAFHEDSAFYFVDRAGVLYHYDLPSGQKRYVADIGAQTSRGGGISAISRLGEDYFVGLAQGGLLVLRSAPDTPERYLTERIDIGAGIFCLLRDIRQRIVWIGTDGQGVYLYSQEEHSLRSTIFDTPAFGIGKPVRALLLDEQNSLWIATKGDGVFRMRDWDFDRPAAAHAIERFEVGNSLLSSNSVYSLSRGERGVMWIGGDEGLDWLDPATGSIRPLAVSVEGEKLRYVHGVVQTGPGTLWIATVGTGMVRVNLEWSGSTPRAHSARRFTTGDGSMHDNYFFAVAAARDGSVWFGNRGRGAFRIKPPAEDFEQVRFSGQGIDRALNDIFCVMEGHGGVMWLGTSAGLVRRAPDGSHRVYDQRSGFPNSTIHGMLDDGQGHIWLSTNFGIIRFELESQTFTTYNRNAPTDVVEFSDGAFFRSPRDGTLLFGGINGFVAIRSGGRHGVDYVPSVTLDRLSIFGREHTLHDYLSQRQEGQTLELSWRENFFSLSLRAIDHLNAHNQRWEYRMDGIGEGWIDNGASNTIHFTKLPAGYYTLRVRCVDSGNGGSIAEYGLRIRIRPPWYTSALARVAYGLLAAGLLWLIIGYLVKRSQLRQAAAIENIREEHQREVYESKLRFFTNIAHEFGTPLTLISGPCERILAHQGSDPFVLRYAGMILRNARRMNGLIGDLIEFRRIETGHKTPRVEPLDISSLVASLLEGFTELAASREFALSVEIPDGIVWNSDRDFMTTILSNLISNAFKYTSRRGEISVRVRAGDEGVSIAVSNTGKGISERNMGRLFDRYSILDDFEQRGEGGQTRNGLGLAIAYDMVQLLGGSIGVESRLGELTTFTVTLPPTPPSQPEALQGGAPAPPIGTVAPAAEDYRAHVEIPARAFDEGKPTVMVVDDERDMLWLLCEIFAPHYNVIALDRSSHIERELRTTIPDALICDVMMPAPDGIAVTRRMKENPSTAHVPIVLVSAKHSIDEQIAGLNAGADLYVAKPFNTDYLKTSVRHLVERKETLKGYFASPMSVYELSGGKLTHVDHRRLLHRVLEVINAEISNPKLSAEFIARAMNMSVRNLYRKLHEAGAGKPMEMIHGCRLHVAGDLLRNTTLTVNEIIYRSGFVNRAPFFRAFSEKYGCTPREYRKKHTGKTVVSG